MDKPMQDITFAFPPIFEGVKDFPTEFSNLLAAQLRDVETSVAVK